MKLGGFDYPLVWGNLALFRFRSIPFAQRGVVGPAQLAQLLWSAYKGIQHPFPSWEHVLSAISDLTSEQYDAIDRAMADALPAVEESKETQSEKTLAKEPSDAEKKSDSIGTAPSPVVASV